LHTHARPPTQLLQPDTNRAAVRQAAELPPRPAHCTPLLAHEGRAAHPWFGRTAVCPAWCQPLHNNSRQSHAALLCGCRLTTLLGVKMSARAHACMHPCVHARARERQPTNAHQPARVVPAYYALAVPPRTGVARLVALWDFHEALVVVQALCTCCTPAGTGDGRGRAPTNLHGSSLPILLLPFPLGQV